MRDFTIALARKVGGFLASHFREDSTLTAKRGTAKEIILKYDKQSDEMIVKEIRKKYPDHNLFTEESGLVDKGSDSTWFVDSLDGTSNFANGNPFFSVSIAVAKKGELQLGVIFAPFLDELYVAERGKGATLNGKRIHVSDTAAIGKSYIVACEGGELTTVPISRICAKLYPKVKDWRKLGSAALEGAAVATGRADAYITTSIHAYDVAAAVLLVREAGGVVTDFEGKEWQLRQGDLLASNRLLHKSILQEVMMR